jgi:hypothetical protein
MAPVDLHDAVIVSPFTDDSTVEGQALRMLVEETAERTGITLETSATWPADAERVIVLASVDRVDGWPRDYPGRVGENLPERRSEGYRVLVDAPIAESPVIWAVGADTRGVLFAAGRLLREMRMTSGRIEIPRTRDIATAPAYPLRGHQMGNRTKANAYDAWTPEVYEQYIRDLIVFGTNAVEQIPFEDPRSSPHWPASREVMNIALSEICARYGLEYWVWTPVMEHRDEHEGALALGSVEERDRIIASWNELFPKLPRLDAVFVPSGDPGINHAPLLMPFLDRLADVLRRSHPQAKIWVSNQFLFPKDLEFMYRYLDEERPDWFGGIAFAMWTQTTVAETRNRLPKQYGLRNYPDITHTERCEYPVLKWDRTFSRTAGREAINPRPVAQQEIHNLLAPDTIGFLTYSDGVNDDVNKFVWSALGWDPNVDLRSALAEYGRYLIHADLDLEIADGLLALEKNWVGPAATNGGIDATLRLWRTYEQRVPALAENNWRFCMGLFRAYYDAYTRHRLLYEQALEHEVNILLADAATQGPARTMFRAERVLRRADLEPVRPAWRERIVQLADRMYDLIGFQTSVERHQQSGYDRGTMLDTVDYPLNNRRWLEDEFRRIRALPDRKAQVDALVAIARYESPVPGTLYDDLGNIAREPHLIRRDGWREETSVRLALNDEVMSWSPYLSRRRISQTDGVGSPPDLQIHLSWSSAIELNLRYLSLDRDARFTFRLRGRKHELSRYAIHADGVELKAMGPPTTSDEIEEYAVPHEVTADGVMRIRFDIAEGRGLHVTETWLIPRE